MAGISLYQPTMRAGVNTGQAQLQSGNLDVAGSFQRNDPLKGVMALTKGVLTLGKHYVDTSRIADVTEQSMLFMKDLSAFKNDYMKNNQGKNAIEAGAAFEAYAEERLAKLSEESGLDWQGRTMLARSTGPAAIGFIGQGHSYGMQQEGAWKDSNAKGAIASLSQFTADNYANPTLIDAQRDVTKAQLAGLYPGMDMTAQFAAIDQQTTSDRIGAYMAAGDNASAKALFTRDRRLLGSRADEMAMKIANAEEHNLRMSLAYDAKREAAERRAQAALSTKAQKDMVDALIGGNKPEANAILSANREFMTAEDYKSYAHAIRRPVESPSDNLYAMNPLLAMQYSADADVRAALPAAAHKAYLDGDITGKTYKDFLNTAVGDGDVAAVRGIDAALEPFARADPSSGLSLQKARAEYAVWSRNNVEATFEQRQAKGLEIGRNYATIDIERMNSMLTFNSYVRKADFNAALGSGQIIQLLDQAEERLDKDAEEGRITISEAQRINAELKTQRVAAERSIKTQKDAAASAAAAAKSRTR